MAPLGKEADKILQTLFGKDCNPGDWTAFTPSTDSADNDVQLKTTVAKVTSNPYFAKYWWTYFVDHKAVDSSCDDFGGAGPVRKAVGILLGALGLEPQEEVDLAPHLTKEGGGNEKTRKPKAQLFVTGLEEGGSRCEAHRDETDSILVVFRGRKTVTLRPKGEKGVKLHARTKYFLADRPLDWNRNKRLMKDWTDIKLSTGDALILPAGWWHQIDSDPGTLAVSLVVLLGQGKGRFR